MNKFDRELFDDTTNKINEIKRQMIMLENKNYEYKKALERVLTAFRVGDIAHTSVNGRGHAAMSEVEDLLREEF